MKLRSVLPFLAWGILQGGCTTEVTQRNCFGGSVTAGQAIHPTLVPVGAQAVVEMRLDRPLSCDSSSQGQIDHREELAVYDPANYPVEADLVALGTNTFEVRFTPKVSGHYHLSLRSSPDGSAAQLDVVAAVDRREDARVSLGETCTKVARTGSGAMVCDSRVFVEGSLAATLPDYDSVVGVGSAIWTLSETTLRRWVHGPAGISGPIEVDFSGVFPMGAPSFTEDEALLMRGSTIERYRVVAGALVLMGALDPEVDWVGRTDDIWRMGDVAFALVVGDSVRPSASVRACSYALLPEGGIQRTETACQFLPGFTVGGNEQEVWTIEQRGAASQLNGSAFPFVVRRYESSAHHLIVSSSVQVPSSVAIAVSDDAGMLVMFIGPSGEPPTEWVLARFVDGAIRLEKFSDAPDFLAATPHGLWFRGSETHFLQP